MQDKTDIYHKFKVHFRSFN